MWTAVELGVSWGKLESMRKFTNGQPRIWQGPFESCEGNFQVLVGIVIAGITLTIDSIIFYSKMRGWTTPKLWCEDLVPFPTH
jgi:hypothetical protein